MRFMSWPSTCFDHPNLATTIFWNPTKPTMPAAWLVREEKPALYHWVPGNFSGPRSVVQRTDKTGRSKWSKSLPTPSLSLSDKFENCPLLKFINFKQRDLRATRRLHVHSTFSVTEKKIWCVEIIQHTDLSFHQREVQVVECIKVPPALPAPQGPAIQRPGASLGHRVVADWWKSDPSTNSKPTNHAWIPNSCIAHVYVCTPRLSCVTICTCWNPLMAWASQTFKPGNPDPHLYLFRQDTTGSGRLHGRYPPADYCKSQVLEILPTTGLCSWKSGKECQLEVLPFFFC